MNNYKGNFDFISDYVARGWAMNLSDSSPVEVSLIVNDKLIKKVKANKFRKDILTKEIHPDGHCGFEIDIPEGIMIYDKENIVNIFVDNDSKKEINNSPKSFCQEGFLKESKNIVQNQLEQEIYKILLVGLPKSGTSILTYTLGDLFKEKEVFFEPKGNHGLSDIDFHRKVIKTNKTVVTKSLFFPSLPNKLKSISNFYNKKIWIYRDPRDWMISEFFYFWYKDHNPNPELFKLALKQVEKKEQNPDEIPLHKIFEFRTNFTNGIYHKWIDRLTSQLDELPDDWFKLKYENFVDKEFTALEQYLNIKINKEDTSKVPTHLNRVVRTKKYGNWRRWFNQEDVEHFSPLLNPLLEKLNYDPNDWNLTPVTKLPANEGSEYMKKLFY